MVLVPFSTILDNKRYYLDSTEEAVSIIEEIGDHYLRILGPYLYFISASSFFAFSLPIEAAFSRSALARSGRFVSL